MPHRRPAAPHRLRHLGVPSFWAITAALQMAEQGMQLYAKNLEFIAEEEKLQRELCWIAAKR